MKCMTVKQPWAYAIMHLGKDIENRTRHTKIRGTIAIHAGKSIDMDAYFELKTKGYELPPYNQLPLGQIIGTVEIIDSVDEHESIWKQEHTVGYVLKNPRPFQHGIEYLGQLGFWNVDDRLVADTPRMILDSEIPIAKTFTKLFLTKSEKPLCSIGEIKHDAEDFTDYFLGEHHYVSREAVAQVLAESGYKVSKGMVYAKWIFPDLGQLTEAFGNKDFASSFVKSEDEVPFFALPSLRVKAMVESYSSAYIKNGRRLVATKFSNHAYKMLRWIEIEGGALAYMVVGDDLLIDSIFASHKRSGVGSKLFTLLLEAATRSKLKGEIVIDAYTDESKAFFAAMAKRYSFILPSDRYSKRDVYGISIETLKQQISQIGAMFEANKTYSL